LLPGSILEAVAVPFLAKFVKADANKQLSDNKNN